MPADGSLSLSSDFLRNASWDRFQGRDLALTSGSGSRAWITRDPAFPLLLVVPDQRQQRELLSDIRTLSLDPVSVSSLPEIPLTLEGMTHKPVRIQRGEELLRWKTGGGTLVCTPGSLLAPYALSEGTFPLSKGEETGRSTLIDWLSSSGYERTETVWSPGQFVVRGSIIDLFDPAARNPVRVEFLDDQVESLRFFNPESQRSTGLVDQVTVSAVREGTLQTLEELMPDQCRVILFEPGEISLQADHYRWVWQGLSQESGSEPLLEWDELYVRLSSKPLLRVKSSVEKVSARIDLQSLPSFKGRRQALETAVAGWKEQGYSISLHTTNESLAAWFSERAFPVSQTPLTSGFLSPLDRIALVADSDVSGIVSLPTMEGHDRPPLEWNDRLPIGEWVVHEDYGIGRFVGIETISSPQSSAQEYLVIEYSGGQRLMVPPFQLWKVTPYLAPRGSEPTADSLKSGLWMKSLSRVRKKVHEAAMELMETYARRETSPGFAFPPDGEYSLEVENSFPYEETADQLRAIEEIRRDMENPHPMDRLLVGDVGYGKTEVALRAAVKAAEAGKQVAVLVPTTLLAQQHFETFRSRTSELPFRIETLCRFVPRKKQGKIIREVAAGGVDILIGTHRLVQKDVLFKELGLVIVDEEHRFGVLHKEHSKGLKPDVDVLMMSATPIPRTLFLSLGGLRDISIISTPPYRRHPVVTVVSPWREDLVIRGILREKARGGQTFFVHNRVADIETRAQGLRLLFPSLSIDIAHGQMPESALEKAMLRFNSGETDILVCTTIIESGLDIPRANTLIVDDSHELGLAQLYQLRGRVGRREEQAFAFFLYPREASLSAEARERLEALGEFSDPGSGYELAQRDLEIRGGGQVVGTAQHGHVERVGYHLYCRMLEEQVSALRGEGTRPVRLEILAPLQIPASYLPQASVRIALYRRLLRAQDRKEIDGIAGEVRDRFGPVPASVRFLFNVALLRLYGEKLGIESIKVDTTETILHGALSPLKAQGALQGWKWGRNWGVGPGNHEGLERLSALITEVFEPKKRQEDEDAQDPPRN